MKPTFGSWYDKKMYATPELAEETGHIEGFLPGVETIAVVGLSKNRHKDSHYVAKYMKNAGYKIIPVNPTADEILGQKAYPDLASIPESVDIVDIFLKPELIPLAVDEAIKLNPKAIWLQLGTGTHDDLAEKVKAAGIEFIQNRCIKVDHQFLVRDKK